MNRPLKLRVALPALALTLAAATAGCGSSDSSGGDVPETVTIGIGGAGVMAYAATYIAREQGYLDEELEAIGSSAKYIDLEGSVAAIQALATEEVDFTTSVASAALAATSEGAEVAQVAQFNTTDMVIMVTDPGNPADPSTPAELVEGKKWGIPGFGSTAHLSALNALDVWGYSADDVEFVTLGHVASSAVAVEQGLADYYWLGTVAEQLIADGVVVEVLDLFDPATSAEYYGGDYVTAGLFALPSYLDDQPEVFEAVTEAHRRALAWIDENSDDIATVKSGLPSEMQNDAADALLARFLPGSSPDGKVSADGIRRVIEVCTTGETITKPDAIDVEAFVRNFDS